MIAGVLAPVILAGCSTDLQKSNALLAKENEDRRVQLSNRNAALSDTEEAMREKDAQIARLQRDEYAQLPLARATGFEQIENVSASYGKGEITVAVASDVLFASGKTVLKSGAKKSLNEVSSVLNRSYPDQMIRIAGHTDSDPIRKSGFASNHHLAFQRAYAVREYLITNGVASNRIALASHGPDQPRATKAASRRVEIVIIAD